MQRRLSACSKALIKYNFATIEAGILSCKWDNDSQTNYKEGTFVFEGLF